MGPVFLERAADAERFARQLGVDADELFAAAQAIWSNLNPQTTQWARALSAAGAALLAVRRVREGE